ncbi:MAG: agmatinase, partial [Fulvivirga sp.]|nr:agmatinase [Fulvivirga sp.]
AKAPPLLRKALHSDMINSYAENMMDVANSLEDFGDFSISQYDEIEAITASNLKKNQHLITLGGDHSITYPIIKAFNNHYQDFAILQIDAHSDLYDSFDGDKYSHACPFARIMEGKYAARLIQMGIRAVTAHQREQAKKFKVEVQTMEHFDTNIINTIKKPLYLTLDLDGLDPAFAPGVSHHEPGGLSTRQVLEIIHKINVPIIGADIVEYNPDRDINDMTASLGAKFLKEITAKIIESHQ